MSKKWCWMRISRGQREIRSILILVLYLGLTSYATIICRLMCDGQERCSWSLVQLALQVGTIPIAAIAVILSFIPWHPSRRGEPSDVVLDKLALSIKLANDLEYRAKVERKWDGLSQVQKQRILEEILIGEPTDRQIEFYSKLSFATLPAGDFEGVAGGIPTFLINTSMLGWYSQDKWPCWPGEEDLLGKNEE